MKSRHSQRRQSQPELRPSELATAMQPLRGAERKIIPGSSRPSCCVFCQDPKKPLTREHLFADWVSVLFGKIEGTAEIHDLSGSVTQTWRSECLPGQAGNRLCGLQQRLDVHDGICCLQNAWANDEEPLDHWNPPPPSIEVGGVGSQDCFGCRSH